MAKTIFVYFGKTKEDYIVSSILHKSKGYKYDIIRLELGSSLNKKPIELHLTPQEAIIISNALISAFTYYKYSKKEIKRRNKKRIKNG